MAGHSKGPRIGFLLKWQQKDRDEARARADALGITMTDYLVQLVRRDELDANGVPIWAEQFAAEQGHLTSASQAA